MAANLQAAGYDLRVHTAAVRPSPMHPWLAPPLPASPAAAVVGCKALLLCVSDDDAVESVLWGEQGAGPALAPGSLVIDCSTISPATA